MPKIVSIIGTDGSGKTTLSDAVADRLSADGLSVARVWLGAESYLTAPVRVVLKALWAGRSTASLGYRGEVDRKHAVASRLAWATRLYVWLILLDYRLQLAAKLWRSRGRSVIIADRYAFDVAVNIGLTLGWSPERVVELSQRLMAVVPVPVVGVFLRVDPEVSLTRKDDIPDADYLRLRLAHYQAIADAFGFVRMDGTEPIECNATSLVDHLRTALARPRVHYVHANNHDVGGADKVLVSMAAHMRHPSHAPQAGFRTTVSLRLPTAAATAHARAGTPVLLHRFHRPQVRSRLSGVLRLVLLGPISFVAFLRLFLRERPDLVHVNDLYDFIPAAAARLLGMPVVYHVRMIQTNPRILDGFRWLLPRVSSAIVSVSNAVRRHYFPVSPPAQAIAIHDLGDPRLVTDQGDLRQPRRRPAGVAEGGRLVVMIGRVEEWKGQHVFLEAIGRLPQRVRQENCFALVGGPVPGREDYFDLIARQATDLGVLMLGERSDVPDLLRAADISVHCSVAPDPFPGVVIESLLSGAATIGSGAGGVLEMINSPAAGVLVPPNDPAALSRALEDLLTARRTPRARFAEPGRAQGLVLIDEKAIDAQMERLYLQVLQAAAAAAGAPSQSESAVNR